MQGAQHAHSRTSSAATGIRVAAAVAAVGGILILGSFFVLPWEKYSSGNTVTGLDWAEGQEGVGDDPNGSAVIAATVAAGVLALIPLLTNVLFRVRRRLWVAALPASIGAVAWLIYSQSALSADNVNAQIGVTIANVGAVAVILAGLVATVLALATRRL